MSADNWTICPRCNLSHELNVEELGRNADKAYGNVSQDEFLELISMRDNPPELFPTLREDYEIGIYDANRFVVSYRAHCSKCGFSFSFKHKEEIKG